MPRKRKILKNAEIFIKMGIDDLKLLKNEVTIELRLQERQILEAAARENALKIRDKIKIGSTVIYHKKGAAQGLKKAEVVGIFPDKVQVMDNGRKSSISLVRIESIR